MNKTVRKITAILSAGLISTSLICSISSTASLDKYSCPNWEVTTYYNPVPSIPQCQRKTSDSSIYVYNNSWNTGKGAYVSIYGNHNGNKYNRQSVSSCSQYWGSLTTEGLYFEPRTAYLVRNYVNEKQYEYAVINVVPEGSVAYGSWKTDIYGENTYGIWNAN